MLRTHASPKQKERAFVAAKPLPPVERKREYRLITVVWQVIGANVLHAGQANAGRGGRVVGSLAVLTANQVWPQPAASKGGCGRGPKWRPGALARFLTGSVQAAR